MDKELCMLMRLSEIRIRIQYKDALFLIGKCRLAGKIVSRILTVDNKVLEMTANNKFVGIEDGVCKEHRSPQAKEKSLLRRIFKL